MNYYNAETETRKLASETWRPTEAMSSQHAGFPSLWSESPNVPQSMMENIGQKPFLLHHGQRFPQYVLFNSYESEEQEFDIKAKFVTIVDVPSDAHSISNHIFTS